MAPTCYAACGRYFSQSGNSPNQIVGHAQIGREKVWSEEKTLRFDFHNFNDLVAQGQELESPFLECHGRSWRVVINPSVKGHSSNSVFNPYLEVMADSEGSSTRTVAPIRFSFHIGMVKLHAQDAKCSNRGTRSERMFCYGYPLDSYGHGLKNVSSKYFSENGSTLTIHATIQVKVNLKRACWAPKQKLKSELLKMMDDPQWADVVFDVGDRSFSAHRAFLALRAPALCEMTKQAQGHVSIPDVQPAIFQAMMRFVYAGELCYDTEFLRSNGRALLEAADRFGCKELKLHIESEIVKSILTVENAGEWVLFADSHSLALLKEAAVDMFVSDTARFMKCPSWVQIKESSELVCELWETKYCSKKRSRDPTNDEEDSDEAIANMDVATLRDKLEANGMDVDGTRVMLVKRLKRE